MHSWLFWRSYLSLLIGLLVLILEIIAFWKMFEKAGEHGRYIFIPWFNLSVLSRIARRTDLFLYIIWWFIACILFWCLGLKMLFILVYLFTMIFCWMISYSVAKNFWRTSSAAPVFVVSPINYLVLWFSDDKYMYKNGQLVLKKTVEKPIDENILNDIENEIHTKHLWEINNINPFDEDYWTDDNIWNWSIQYSQNIPNS